MSKFTTISRKSSKHTLLNVDDFNGDLRAFKYADNYVKLLTGDELQRMKNIESREKIKYILFLVVTITLNVLNLFACATFVIEDYISYADDCTEESQDAECYNVGLEAIEKLEVTFSIIFLMEMIYNFK